MAVKDRKIRRLSRLGIIRLGYLEKRQREDGSTYTFPAQADHFLLHDAPDIAEFYHERGINEVREMDVRLPFRDIESNFPSFYQVWAGGVCVCQGDGEYVQYATPFTVSVDKKKRTHVRNAPGDTLVLNGVAQVDFSWNGVDFVQGEIVPCPGKAKELYPHCAACRLSCILKVMMADPALFRFGYYQISTGSTRNHDTIMGVLENMPTHNVNDMPFKLRMIEEATTYKDEKTGMRRKGKRFFLQLEPDPTTTRRLYARATERMIEAPPEAPDRPALPAMIESEDVWDNGGDDGIYEEAEDPAPPPFAEVQDDAPPEKIEPEPEPEPRIWTLAEASALFRWTRRDKGLDDADVLKALKVAGLKDCLLTVREAKKAIDAWIAEQAGT